MGGRSPVQPQLGEAMHGRNKRQVPVTISPMSHIDAFVQRIYGGDGILEMQRLHRVDIPLLNTLSIAATYRELYSSPTSCWKLNSGLKSPLPIW